MNKLRRWLRKNNWTTRDPWSEVAILILFSALWGTSFWLLVLMQQGRL